MRTNISVVHGTKIAGARRRPSPRRIRERGASGLFEFLICLFLQAVMSVGAQAQNLRSAPSQVPLATSIRMLARERNIEILFSPGFLRGQMVQLRSFRGPVDSVLASLLGNSGISFRRTSDGIYYLIRPERHRAAVTLTPLRSSPKPRAAQQDEAEQAPIIVTARKREELLAQTPIAITALSARQIAESGSRKLEDLLPFAPGVYFSQQGFLRPGRVDANVRFRRMAINVGTPQEQLATVFVDGVPVSDGVQSLSLEDAERVEVINGPQSAIFGRSTFGGAVNIITRPPSQQLTLRTDSTVETNGDFDLSSSIEGPILSDKLAGRISARVLRNEGDYKNPTAPGQRLGRQATDSLAANLRLTMGNFGASARVRFSHDDDGPPAGWALGVVEANCGPFNGGTRRTICGSIPGIGTARFGQNTGDGRAIADFLRRRALSQGLILSPPSEYGMNRFTWDASFHMSLAIPSAKLRLEANGGVNRRRRSILSDSDLSPDRVTIAYYPMRSSDSSLELRIRSQADELFNWSLGSAYFDQRYRETVEGIYGALVLPFNYAPSCTVAPINCDPSTRISPGSGDLYLGTLPYFIGHVTTKALFGSAGLELSPHLNGSVELRREWDRVQDTTLTNDPLSKSFAALLYRVVLSAHPDENSMFYVSASNGNLPGRFNASVIGASSAARQQLATVGATDSLPQQTLQNLEAGYKLKTARVSLSVAAYRMQWRRQRIRQTFFDAGTGRTISYLSAVGSSNLHGLELQASWHPIDWLTIGLVGDVATARYKKQSSLVALRVLGMEDVSGNSAPGAPGHSGTLSATVAGRLDADRTWYARADALYRGRFFVDELNLTTLPPTVTLNARAGIRSDRFGIELFATNILQSRVPKFAAAQADISAYVPAFNFTYPGFITEAPPTRKFGIKISSNF